MMRPEPKERPPGDGIDRRRFLAAALLGLAAPTARDDVSDGEERALREAADELRTAGIGPLRGGRSRHYQVIGNAPDDLLHLALDTCEAFLSRYLDHFGKLGLPADEPDGRLTLVAVANRADFIRVIGPELGSQNVGLYRPSTNRMIVFDARTELAGQSRPDQDRAIQMAIRHEAAHQLTFNTGLLRRGCDAPHSVAEGLAMYCEPLTPDGHDGLGRVHHHWLDRLWQADHPGTCELGVEYLLTSNAWTHVLKGHDDQHALAHAWVLVHYLMSDPTVRAGFLAYLRACGRRDYLPPDDPRAVAARRTTARDHLGDFDRLDAALRLHAERARSGLLPGSSRFGPAARRR
jgi:hypothetical protein